MTSGEKSDSRTSCWLLALVWFVCWGPGSIRAQADGEAILTACGMVEAKEIRIASEIGGRILQIQTQVGAEVHAGDELVILDATPCLLELSVAESAVATAQADLALVKAGPRSQEILAAQAALALAEAQRDGALANWENAQAAIEDPQELDARLTEARTQLALAEQRAELAEAELARQQLIHDQTPENSIQRNAADLQVRAADETLAATLADQQAAQRLVNWLWLIRSEPLQLIAQANLAKGKYRLAEAQVAIAQAQFDDVLAGPTPEEIAVAEAAVGQAQAEANALRTKIDQLTLKSPIDGIVLSQSLRQGELAAPAAPIISLANLTEVRLIGYVPENQIGQVQLGQEVSVVVDSFANRSFVGHVVHVSDQPEFTPRNVVVAEERLNTFYAVEIHLLNPEGLLKPGMPADMTFLAAGS
jgi:HlyD family secretion protein